MPGEIDVFISALHAETSILRYFPEHRGLRSANWLSPQRHRQGRPVQRCLSSQNRGGQGSKPR